MTTQATQSNNALGRRSSPSSFFAPLQTLGLNLDRRKSSGRTFDGTNPYGAPAGQESRTEGRDDLDPGDNRDIRTAAPATGRPQINSSRTAAAFGLKDDPAAALRQAAYPARDRELDPELVRGAISRLAREYALPETDLAASHLESSHPSASHPAASVRPEPPNDFGSQPIAFAEVARRVWAEAESEHLAAHQPSAQSPYQSAPQAAPDARGTEWEDAEREKAELYAAEREAAQLGDSAPPLYAAAAGYMPDLNPDARLDSQLNSRLNSRLGPATGLDEARALAHDAGNLLSALRLYGDLLCFSGVLHERHRHYAIDLKLLSLRSESLIGRLLTLADEVALAGSYASVPVRAQSSIPVQAAATVAAHGTAYATAHGTPDRTAPRAVPSFFPSFAPDRSQGYTSNFNSDPGLETGRSQEESVEAVETSNLADILTRMRGLLGTIAHGALDLDAGSHESLDIAAPGEVVERILVNLVSNAAAAVRGGGAIRVRAGVGAGEIGAGIETGFGTASATPVVVLTVDDSGCGMSEAQIRAALSLDPQTGPASASEGVASEGVAPEDGASQDGEGSRPASRERLSRAASAGAADLQHGLGLLIVRDLVASTGGRLFIHSRQGTGTRMEIQWRAAEVPSLAGGRTGEIEETGELLSSDRRLSNGRSPESHGAPRREEARWAAPDSASQTRPEIWPGVRTGFIPPVEAGPNRTGLRSESQRAEKRAAFTNVAKGAVA